VRKGYEWTTKPTISAVYTSYYISLVQQNLSQSDAAWIHLRQAMTIAHVIGLQNEANYHVVDDAREVSARRRLFWALFIYERYVLFRKVLYRRLTMARFYTLKYKRPLTLTASIQLPNPNDDPEEAQTVSGFVHLISLYKPLDEFFTLWAGSSRGTTQVFIGHCLRLLAEGVPEYFESSEVQALDLKISQQWLRALVWKLGSSLGLAPSMTEDGLLSLGSLVQICSELVERCDAFSRGPMQHHGAYLVRLCVQILHIRLLTHVNRLRKSQMSLPSSSMPSPRCHIRQIMKSGIAS
jgi:hypothetical protein